MPHSLHKERFPLFPLTGLHLPSQAIWSHSGSWRTIPWMTVCLWQPQTWRTGWARVSLCSVQSCRGDRTGVVYNRRAHSSLSHLDEWFLPGHRQAPLQQAAPFFPEVHNEMTDDLWHTHYSACLCTSASPALTSVNEASQKGYKKLPPMDETMACPMPLNGR